MSKKKTSRMNKEERRSQILESALKVFIENGYNKATTQGIADAAAISEVTLFRYFDSKEEIFKEAVEPIIMSTLNKSIFDAKDLNSLEKLRHILKERLRVVNKYGEVIKLVLRESEINSEISNINYIGKTSLLLKESIKKAGLENGEDEFMLRVLMGSILSFLYLPEKDENKIDLFVDRILSIITDKNNMQKEG